MYIDYDKIFEKIDEIGAQSFSRYVYWPKLEEYLRKENSQSKILTDFAFLDRFVNVRADGFHFLKATFGEEYGEYIFDEEVLDSALRKTKDNWQHFPEDKKELFELEYQVYYGNSNERREARKTIQELKKKETSVAADDEDIPDKKFDTYETEIMNGTSKEEAMKKAEESENEKEQSEKQAEPMQTDSADMTQKTETESAAADKETSDTPPEEPAPDTTPPQNPPTDSDSKEESQVDNPPKKDDPQEPAPDSQATTQPAPEQPQNPSMRKETIDAAREQKITPKGYISERMRSSRPLRPLRRMQEDNQPQQQMLDYLRQQKRTLEDSLAQMQDNLDQQKENLLRLQEDKIARDGKIDRLVGQLDDARKHRAELEEVKMKQDVELQRITGELATTRSELEDLKRANHLQSQDSLSSTLENAITQTSRIVLYCTVLAIASIFLVIFAFLR